MKSSTIFLLSVLACSSINAQNTNSKLPIIDVHLHAHPYWGPESGMASDTSWFPSELTRPQTSELLMTQSLAMLEKYNIVKAVTSGSLNQQWQAEAPDRIIMAGGGGSNVFSSMKLLAQIRERIKKGEIQVLSEVAWQYAGVSPDDSVVMAFWEMAEELDIPVGIHMGLGPPGITNGGSKYRIRLSSALLLEDVLARHPNLRVFVMHAGWPLLDDMIALLYSYPQVYVDIAVINWYIPRPEFHSYLKRMVEAGFGKRIMFGSDQMQWPKSIGIAIESIESAPFLTESQKRDIYYNNAARFLRFSQEEIDKHHLNTKD